VKAQLRQAIALAALLLGCSVVLIAQAPNDAADVVRLVALLDLHADSVVADIGAGFGPLTIRIASHVAQGTVYSTDIEPTQVQAIRNAAARAGLRNVTVVEGGLTETNLPANSCDGIFMRDVYHHFGDPPSMNDSLLRALKPGGRIAVVDFVPRSGHTAALGKRDQAADHGILPADLIDELKASGFEGVYEVPWSSPGYFAVVGMRPR
jgi:ubiquinone/menaquinone biosynthesis C-methylase UbiE